MGRFYYGDIEGKFWFALQSSESPSRFAEDAQTMITYRFTEDHVEEIQDEIDNITEELGDKVNVIEKMFSESSGWNDEMLQQMGITKNELADYADLELGKKILKCVEENGECNIDCEC